MECHWATSLAFKSILIYALLLFPLSLCVPRLAHCRCPYALPLSKTVHTTSYSSLLYHNAHDTVQRHEKMERWTLNSITHVLQRCWFPGELSPALCPNPFSTWKADKCASGTSSLAFCLLADGIYHCFYLTWEIVCCKVRQIYNREVNSRSITAVVNISRNCL